MNEEIDKIKEKGKDIYDEVHKIIKGLGSVEYITPKEKIKGKLSGRSTNTDFTVYRTEYNSKELEIKVNGRYYRRDTPSWCKKKKVFYDDELVFSGERRNDIHTLPSGDRYYYNFDKVILCEWVKKIDEMVETAEYKIKEEQVKEMEEREKELKEKFQRRCEV